MNMALPTGNRLGLKDGIDDVIKKGRTLDSEFFRIKYLLDGTGFKKFAISASSRIFKRAVERNLVRRLLGETIRKNLSMIKPGIKAVIMVKKDILTRKKPGMEKELENILKASR